MAISRGGIQSRSEFHVLLCARLLAFGPLQQYLKFPGRGCVGNAKVLKEVALACLPLKETRDFQSSIVSIRAHKSCH